MTARCACGCTSPTSRRSCGRARRSTARRSGARTRSTCPAWSSRCCPRRSPTARARSSPAGPADGDGRARVRGREGPPQRVPSLADPLRRAARLPAGGSHLRRCGARRGAVGGAAGRRAARRRRRWPRRARRRARWRSSRVEPEFALLARRPRRDAAAVRADRVAQADRVPDDRRQRGGRDAARDAQAARAVPRARAARSRRGWSGCSRSSPRSTCRRRRSAST